MKKKIKQNLFYSKFLGALIKKGGITKAKNILNLVLFKISKATKFSFSQTLSIVFLSLNTFIEIRKVRSKRQTNYVPFPVSYSRRIFLTLKWILIAVSKDKRRVPFANKLFLEIFKIVNKLPSEAVNIKIANNLQAYSNRSNIHFRW